MQQVQVIRQFILDVRALYNLFSNDFYAKVSPRHLVNLKHLLVDDLDTVVGFDLVRAYIHELDQSQLLRLLYPWAATGQRRALHIQYRVKNLETVTLKYRYNCDKQRYVSKIFNDFFGFRIIVDDSLLIESVLLEELTKLKKQKIISRFYVRQDGDYMAIHVYFQSTNRYFPWELQIWRQRQAKKTMLRIGNMNRSGENDTLSTLYFTS